MRCEVCGRNIFGKNFKVVIEGANMTVCGGCAELSSGYWEEPPAATTRIKKQQAKRTKKQRQEIDQPLELVEDFGLRIKQARQKLELDHEELGRKIGEKVSVLKKIEAEKMHPSNILANKLEHALKIKLLVPVTRVKLSQIAMPPRKVTLGDFLQIKEKKEE